MRSTEPASSSGRTRPDATSNAWSGASSVLTPTYASGRLGDASSATIAPTGSSTSPSPMPDRDARRRRPCASARSTSSNSSPDAATDISVSADSGTTSLTPASGASRSIATTRPRGASRSVRSRAIDPTVRMNSNSATASSTARTHSPSTDRPWAVVRGYAHTRLRRSVPRPTMTMTQRPSADTSAQGIRRSSPSNATTSSSDASPTRCSIRRAGPNSSVSVPRACVAWS